MVPYVDGLIFKLINFPSHLNWNQGILNMTVGKLLDAKYYKSENIIEWPINFMNPPLFIKRLSGEIFMRYHGQDGTVFTGYLGRDGTVLIR